MPISEPLFWRAVRRWIEQAEKENPEIDIDVALQQWQDADWRIYLDSGPTDFVKGEREYLDYLYPGVAGWIIANIFEREARDREAVEQAAYEKKREWIISQLRKWHDEHDEDVGRTLLREWVYLKRLKEDPSIPEDIDFTVDEYFDKFGAEIETLKELKKTQDEMTFMRREFERSERKMAKKMKRAEELTREQAREAARDFPDRPKLDGMLAELDAITDELKFRGKITEDELWIARRDSKEVVDRLHSEILSGKQDPATAQAWAERSVQDVLDRTYEKIRARVPQEELGKPRPAEVPQEVEGEVAPTDLQTRIQLRKMEAEQDKRFRRLEEVLGRQLREMKDTTAEFKEITEKWKRRRPPAERPPPPPKVKIEEEDHGKVVGPPTRERFATIEMKRSPTPIPCAKCEVEFYPWTAEIEATFKMIPYFFQDKFYFILCEACKAAGHSPMAKHAYLPDLCDWVYEALVTGDVRGRPYLSKGAFIAVGVPEDWVDRCLEAKAFTDELLTR